jgi:hypothetical protein
MAETTLLEKTAELVANAQNNVSDASPHLAEGIAKEATRFTPPIADDVMKMAGHVFDFAQQAPGVAELPARLAVTYALLPSNEVDNSDHASVNRFVKALLLPALNGLRRRAPRVLRPAA